MGKTLKYCVKSSYIENKKINKINIDGKYWNSKRIKRNLYSNYYVYQFAQSVLLENRIKNLLDIGCGAGIKLSYFFKDLVPEIYAIDADNAIKYCKNNYNFGKFLSFDIENKSTWDKIEGKKFDMIICVDVIEHLNDPDLLIELIKKFSNPMTYVVISTPERNVLRGKNCNYSPNSEHVREWNVNEFSEYLNSKNFEILDHFLLPPIKPNLSIFFLKNFLWSKIRFKKFLGTQVVQLMVNQDR